MCACSEGGVNTWFVPVSIDVEEPDGPWTALHAQVFVLNELRLQRGDPGRKTSLRRLSARFRWLGESGKAAGQPCQNRARRFLADAMGLRLSRSGRFLALDGRYQQKPFVGVYDPPRVEVVATDPVLDTAKSPASLSFAEEQAELFAEPAREPACAAAGAGQKEHFVTKSSRSGHKTKSKNPKTTTGSPNQTLCPETRLVTSVSQNEPHTYRDKIRKKNSALHARAWARGERGFVDALYEAETTGMAQLVATAAYRAGVDWSAEAILHSVRTLGPRAFAELLDEIRAGNAPRDVQNPVGYLTWACQNPHKALKSGRHGQKRRPGMHRGAFSWVPPLEGDLTTSGSLGGTVPGNAPMAIVSPGAWLDKHEGFTNEDRRRYWSTTGPSRRSQFLRSLARVDGEVVSNAYQTHVEFGLIRETISGPDQINEIEVQQLLESVCEHGGGLGIELKPRRPLLALQAEELADFWRDAA